MTAMEPQQEELTYCALHPRRETALRCNRCERTMCHECAVHTPVGYRCRECVKEQDRQFFDARLTDELLIVLVCALVAAVGMVVLAFFRFLLFALLLAVILGPFAGECARRVTGRRRSQRAALAAGVGALLGTLVVGLLWQGLTLSALLFAALYASFASGRLRWGR
ncbi:MAG: hypothetical protein OXF83_06090 [Anaerolineaceae bacterium]|nr:hypothetical protein [Anaerolineaceae bacterium]MCY3935583.1 hypothetical protein [Chloroflexota bacterium]MCY4009007.1 hypothetical protein [Anaerolineaceae bacterium]MCY4105771.1 hypothetical protein [Chloroflexota bacterium]